MLSIATQQQLASAHVVFFGPYGAVTLLAQQRGDSRQTLYRQAHAVAKAVEGNESRQQRDDLRTENNQLRNHIADLDPYSAA